MKILKLINDHIEEYLLVIIYTVMLLIATAQVFFRYVINLSISWSQDLLTYLLIWSVFIGISLAVKKRKHIKVELAFIILPPKFQYHLKVFSNMAFIAFGLVISYFSMIKIHKLIFINPQISESTGLSMWIIQIAVPFGLMLSVFRLIQDTIKLRKHYKGGDESCQ